MPHGNGAHRNDLKEERADACTCISNAYAELTMFMFGYPIKVLGRIQ